MNLTTEIENYEKQLNKLLKDLRQLEPTDALYPSMIAYICIRITGYMEVALDELLIKHASQETKSPTLSNVITEYIGQYNSANNENIKKMLSAFNPQWSDDFASEMQKESKGKVDLVQSLKAMFGFRNKVAHGRDVNITPSSLREYFESAKKIVRIIANVIP